MTPLQQILLVTTVVLPLLASSPAKTVPSIAVARILTDENRRQIEMLAADAVKFHLEKPIRNWGGGSCVHAAMVNLLHWQQQHQLADWWRAHHQGGESADHMAKQLDAAGIRWAGTTAGDESFLKWATENRRGCGVAIQVPQYDRWGRDVSYPANHMVCLVGMDDQTVSIFDSNDPGKISVRDRAQFLSNWHRSGGWAITPVYDPPPPKPWMIREEDQ